MIGLQDHAAAAPAVAPAGSALRNVGFTMERDAAFAAMTRPRINFDFVDEHLFLVLISIPNPKPDQAVDHDCDCENKKGEADASP
jgi:hypothetical protein